MRKIKKILIKFNFFENLYYSFILSFKNGFRIMFFFRDYERRDISKVTLFDSGLYKKMDFFIPTESKRLFLEIFYYNNYIIYRDKIHAFLKRRFPNKRSNLLDLGANVGLFSIYYHFFLDDKPFLYLFEPLPFNVDILEKNVKKNNIETYRIFQRAVCDESDGYVNLFVGGSTTGCTILKTEDYAKNQATGKIIVKSMKIDDLGLKDIGLIKIDIEGAEYIALKGMQKTISVNNPIIICSYEHKTNNKNKIVNLIKKCADYDYKDDEINKFLYFFPKRGYI